MCVFLTVLYLIMYQVIFRALNPQIPIKNPYSEKVQNLLKLTNIRINFTKLHTLGDLVLDPTQPEARLKYYYAVYNLVIRGSCSCYGHAEQCLPLDDSEQDITGMVRNCVKLKVFKSNTNLLIEIQKIQNYVII